MNREYCAGCQTDNYAGATFCRHCGHLLEVSGANAAGSAPALNKNLQTSVNMAENGPQAEIVAPRGAGCGLPALLLSIGVLLLFILFFSRAAYIVVQMMAVPAVLALLAAVGALLYTTSSKAIRNNAFLAGLPAMVLDPLKTSRRLAKIAAFTAILPLLGILLFNLPPVKGRLLLREHRTLKFYLNNPGLAAEEQLYDETYGPLLAGNREVIDNRIANDPESKYGFYYAALKFQGLKDEEILQLPKGRELLAAAVLTEYDPAPWAAKAPWLSAALNVRPAGTFRLGVLDYEKTRRLLHELIDSPAGQDAACALKLLRLAAKDGRLIEQPQVASLLDRAAQTSPGNGRILTDFAPQREKLRALAAAVASPDGTIETGLVYPANAGADEKERMTEITRSLLALCGFTYVPGTRLKIDLTLESRYFSDVSSTETVREMQKVTETYQVPVQRATGTGKYRRVYTEMQSHTRQVEKMMPVTKTDHGGISAPTLVINARADNAKVEISLPPADGIAREDAEKANKMLAGPAGEDAGRRELFQRTVFAPWFFAR